MCVLCSPLTVVPLSSLLLRLGVLSLLVAFFPRAKALPRGASVGVAPDHPAAQSWSAADIQEQRAPLVVSPTRPRGSTLPSTGARDVAKAVATGKMDMGRAAPRVTGTSLPSLPLPLFTLMAAVCRERAVIADVCSHGLLQFAVDRFILDTADPGTDLKVRAACVRGGGGV
jgi:hypothetical protein